MCSKCSTTKHSVNRFFDLCLECNNVRLHGNKFGKTNKISLNNKTKSKTKKNKSISAPTFEKEVQKISNLQKDEELYEKCFNLSNHLCEECSTQLPTQFRIDGKIIARYRYSHIIPKSIAPNLRHEVSNINNLCLLCHSKWENGDKSKMKIYSENIKKFPNYF
ncbi:hypothetical protein Phi19:2_gp034 [Cellulophaga phage phi19:2]|uniref:HNH endonuclease n=3 Tax=Cellulophaga phage phiST TaxID=756282 RepID=M4SPU6_9CAUD|nr:hypothetical protein CGPG_00073 [Cellulophaga phage phiST]AGH56771.1 hypothetical protein CGPG_00073 [Cellulophaga phage phiST]AGO47173.1 hypothetical protein PhiST_gp034 [Cellulophaga phage phiST]AGO48669.1 hypothetical protein Phi19:2_gp034 [Cellulophaga phage phi19:2]AGO49039.1 hypothetical protein Phi13:1_gp028 [Cellulophaga phage phi13:1]